MRFKRKMVNIMSRSSIRIMLLGVFSQVFGATGLAMAATLPNYDGGFSSLSGPPVMPNAGQTHISNRSLSEIRGGFSIPDNPGISVDFGFSIQTLVNGKLVQNLTGDVKNITQTITPTFYNAGSNRIETNGSQHTYTAPQGNSVVSFQGIKNNAPSSPNTSNTESTTQSSQTFTTIISNQSESSSALATTIANTIGSSGITTSIQNQSNNQIIQEARTLNLNITGMQAQLLNTAQANQLMRALTPR